MQIKRKYLLETILVLIVIALLTVWMIPKFLQNLTMTEIHESEKNLKLLLRQIQDIDGEYGKKFYQNTIKPSPNMPNVWFIPTESISEIYPTIDFNIPESSFMARAYLGLDHRATQEEMQTRTHFPTAVFVDLNSHRSEKNLFHYFERKYIDSKYIYFVPKPEAYFAVSNGLDSNGMIYFDTEGRSSKEKPSQSE